MIMTTAEIITIGTELLLGDILDINTPFISKELNKLGIDVFRTITVGDNPVRISQQILESLERATIIFTTGGLGPTIDDPTRQAVANALDVPLIFHPVLWEQILDRFKQFHHTPTENNRRQAYIPQGAVAIENSVGTAPAFYCRLKESVLICLPGVPTEVTHIFHDKINHLLVDLFHTASTTFTRVIKTAGLGESSIDNLIGDFEKLKNPTVGITAHPGQVDIRITAKAEDVPTAKSMIQPIENEIVNILNDYVYGYDEDSLRNIVLDLIFKKGYEITIYYPSEIEVRVIDLDLLILFPKTKKLGRDEYKKCISDGSLYNNNNEYSIGIFLDFKLHDYKRFMLTIITNQHKESKEFFFGGHESLFNERIENYTLNMILNTIKNR